MSACCCCCCTNLLSLLGAIEKPGAQQQQPGRGSPCRRWTRPAARSLTHSSGRSDASGGRKRLAWNAQRASQRVAHLAAEVRGCRGKVRLAVIAHALYDAQGATACTLSRSTWTTRYRSSGTARRRASLTQMSAVRAPRPRLCGHHAPASCAPRLCAARRSGADAAAGGGAETGRAAAAWERRHRTAAPVGLV